MDLSNKEIFKRALEYYDIQTEKNRDFIDSVEKVEMEIAKEDTRKSLIIFFDKKGNRIGKAPFEILGVYNNLNHLWTWAWAVRTFAKNARTLAKQLFDYAYDLVEGVEANNDYGMYLKDELLNSKFIIKDITQIDLYLALGLYLSKKKIIYPYILRNNNKPEDYTIYYMILLTDLN